MSLTQDLIQKNSLNLTPQLRQSLKILEIDIDELQKLLEEKQKENPVLNVITPGISVNRYSNNNQPYDKKQFLENTIKETQSLDSLIEQQTNIAFHKRQTEKNIAFILYENLNHNGYLELNLKEVISIYSQRFDQSIELKDVENVLKKCQSFEPIGIFSRTLQECMLINAQNEPWFNDNVKIIIDNIEQIAKGKINLIEKQTKLSKDEILEVVAKIKKFDLLPARNANNVTTQEIIPDIIVERDLETNTLCVRLNENILPKIMVDSTMHKEYKENDLNKDAAEFIKNKYNEAVFYKRAIEQRYSTLLKVANCIVQKQENFFELGKRALRPMTLNDIAAEIGMHESTISRAVNNKYMQTPVGSFELKYFLTKAIKGSGAVNSFSNESIKHMIKAMIDNEDPRKPLSDDKIVEKLRLQKIDIARRTVTKYRESLNIPSSFERRKKIVI